MKVTIMTSLFTEWDMDVDSGHKIGDGLSVLGSGFWVLGYLLIFPSFCFTKAAHPV